jgi:hypothetical protein
LIQYSTISWNIFSFQFPFLLSGLFMIHDPPMKHRYPCPGDP